MTNAQGNRGWTAVLFAGIMMMLAAAVTAHAAVTPQRGKVQNSAAGLSALPVAAQGSISARLGRDLPAYRIRPASGGFEAQNTKNTLKADFTPEGVMTHVAGAVWGMALRGVGHGENLTTIERAIPHASANRVEYRRGPLTEWYVNGPLGLEQGFTLTRPPSSDPRPPNSSPLTLALTLSGNVAAAVTDGSKGLTLAADAKPVLHYTGLTAYDADGKQLRAWLAVQGEQLLLKAEDAGARYPVVIDPIIEHAELTASDGGEFDELGIAVAISGNTVVAGAPDNNNVGAVYVFVESVSGWANMTQTAKLTASDGVPYDALGSSVAFSGNTVVAGAPQANVGSNQYQGAAYVFVEPAGGWANMTETAKLTASDGAAFDGLGNSAAISGDTVLVGAANKTIGSNTGQGAAYIFVEPASGWQTTSTFSAELTASNGLASDSLGYSVGVSGKTAVVGTGAAEAAYVFVRPASGWMNTAETAELTVPGYPKVLCFGQSISVSANTIVAGAPCTSVTQFGQGAAYVFVEPPHGWQTTSNFNARLTALDPQRNSLLGRSVAISGKTVIAGAPFAGPGGKAYTFLEPQGGWTNMTQTVELIPLPGKVEAQYFGTSVAVIGKTVMIGAPANTENGGSYQGESYVYVFGP
jgi:hypothetical protein